MSTPNLLPSTFKQRIKERHRIRQWGRVAFTVAFVGVVACVAAGVYLRDMDSPVREELQGMQSVINKLEASEAAAWASIEKVSHELGVAEDIAGQPDWSVLLGVLAAGLTEGTYLERIDTSIKMEPGTKISPPATTASGPYTVTIRGVSYLQGDVARYAVYLEQCRLFDSVRLITTQPRPDLESRAVGFEIACEIGTPRGTKP